MDTFNYKEYLKNNPLLQENEGEELIDDIKDLGNDLAGAIEGELEKHEDQLNEGAGAIGILGWVLLSNTIAHMISNFAKKRFEKSGNLKGKEWADWFLKNTHKIETGFKAPIKTVLSFFIKDEKKLKIITDILYAITIFSMAGSAGGDAVGYIKKAGYFKGAIYGLKAAIKGVEVNQILKGVIEDMLS